MSFSVKAVESPSPQLSPYIHPYVSPQILPQAGQRVPSMSLNEEHQPSKRVGTDPTKYKTTICRNWEQTGTCTFRGCTFAHGVEELRAPVRIDHGSTPLLHSQYVSPGSTPPLMAANGAAANHFAAAAGGPPKLEGLLELLHSEVARERELVAVHMEANRTLEGMLRREQVHHAETKAQLEERRAECAVLMDIVARQHAYLNGLLQQGEGSYPNGGLSTSSDYSVSAADNARILVEHTSALLQGDITFTGNLEATNPADGVNGAAKESGSSPANSSDDDTGDAKEKEKERIEEILRALQQPQHS